MKPHWDIGIEPASLETDEREVAPDLRVSVIQDVRFREGLLRLAQFSQSVTGDSDSCEYKICIR